MMLPAWIIDFFQPQGVKCLRCGMAYFDELNAGLCPMCALHVSRMEPGDLRHELEHGRGELDWAAAAFRYGDGVRQRVLALKFSGARRLGEDMGRDMLEAFNALPVSPDALVPVPLHWRRKISRRGAFTRAGRGGRRSGRYVRACAQTLYPPQCKAGARRATVQRCGRVCGG